HRIPPLCPLAGSLSGSLSQKPHAAHHFRRNTAPPLFTKAGLAWRAEAAQQRRRDPATQPARALSAEALAKADPRAEKTSFDACASRFKSGPLISLTYGRDSSRSQCTEARRGGAGARLCAGRHEARTRHRLDG